MHGYCGWFRPKSVFIWPSFHHPTEQKRRVERVEILHGIRTVQGRSRGQEEARNSKTQTSPITFPIQF